MNDGWASVAEHYHEDTKYDPSTMHLLPRANFEKQASPFKTLHSQQTIDLVPYLPDVSPLERSGEGESWRAAVDPASEFSRLARLLYYSYGATGRIIWSGGQQILRASPSAGGLYPIELYVVSEGLPDIPDGLSNYSALQHHLVPVFDVAIKDELWRAVYRHPLCESAQLFLLLTGIYARSNWRYHERCYRRILLDTGHLLGNIHQCAPTEGWRVDSICTTFNDDYLNSLCFFDTNEEVALAVVPLVDDRVLDALPCRTAPLRRPAELVAPPEEPSEWLYQDYHRASSLIDRTTEVPQRYPTPYSMDTGPLASDERPLGPPLELTADELPGLVINRRSTREFTGGPIERQTLEAMIGYAYAPVAEQLRGERGPQLFQLPEWIETHLIVNNVDGLPPGVYRYRPETALLQSTVRSLVRTDIEYACLGQNLVGRASAVVVHACDLSGATMAIGERAYRLMHIDAGHIGQRLSLAAVHLNVGVSGIGGFFDDAINTVIQVPESYAILYVTVLGQIPSGS